MSLIRNHVALMFFYAVECGVFFSLLWKSGRAERIWFFVRVFVSLFIGGIALAWVIRDGQDGLLVPCGDVGGLAQALLRLADGARSASYGSETVRAYSILHSSRDTLTPHLVLLIPF